MERFEIALATDGERLLIPSMLPQERPGMDLNRMQRTFSKQKSADTVDSSDWPCPGGTKHDDDAVDCVQRRYQVSSIHIYLFICLFTYFKKTFLCQGFREQLYNKIYC